MEDVVPGILVQLTNSYKVLSCFSPHQSAPILTINYTGPPDSAQIPDQFIHMYANFLTLHVDAPRKPNLNVMLKRKLQILRGKSEKYRRTMVSAVEESLSGVDRQYRDYIRDIIKK